jgi:DNA-directed RNA polymerase specialized sigma24 family protein
MQARQLVREFLSVTPRDEETATITIPRADGTITTLTRAHLTAAIERLRPRMRQIVRLGVEGRHSQEEIAAFLGGISTRTVQRDLAEALDLLARLD